MICSCSHFAASFLNLHPMILNDSTSKNRTSIRAEQKNQSTCAQVTSNLTIPFMIFSILSAWTNHGLIPRVLLVLRLPLVLLPRTCMHSLPSGAILSVKESRPHSVSSLHACIGCLIGDQGPADHSISLKLSFKSEAASLFLFQE